VSKAICPVPDASQLPQKLAITAVYPICLSS
jgi:hypothetical protein